MNILPITMQMAIGPSAHLSVLPHFQNAVWDTAGDGTYYYGNDTRDLNFYGSGGKDVFYGGSGNDYLSESGQGYNGWHVGDSRGATPGVDAACLDGGNGNDTLSIQQGATGSLMLIGGFGDDTFFVNGGTNVYVSGGDGADTFNFGASFAGHAEIQSFQRGPDHLSMGAGWTLDNVASGHGSDFATFTNAATGGHLVVDGTSHDTMVTMSHGGGQYY